MNDTQIEAVEAAMETHWSECKGQGRQIINLYKAFHYKICKQSTMRRKKFQLCHGSLQCSTHKERCDIFDVAKLNIRPADRLFESKY